MRGMRASVSTRVYGIGSAADTDGGSISSNCRCRLSSAGRRRLRSVSGDRERDLSGGREGEGDLGYLSVSEDRMCEY